VKREFKSPSAGGKIPAVHPEIPHGTPLVSRRKDPGGKHRFTEPGPARFLTALCMTLLILPGAASSRGKDASAELELIRRRIIEPLLEPVDEGTVTKLLDSMEPDGSWRDIDYEDRNKANWKTTRHLSNLLLLTRAYAVRSSSMRGDERLRPAIYSALDFWLEHDYENPNWWWNVIGVPGRLARVLLLLDDELDAERREKGTAILSRAKIGMTGANLVDVAYITVMRGILQRDSALVAEAVASITDEIRITTEEGIQPDFSFHQHGPLLYNHGYGAVFMRNCSRLAVTVTGTRFEFPREKIELLNGLILDGTQWMIRRSTKDYGATGRGITRRQGENESAGYLRGVAENMLRLPTGRAKEYRDLLSRMNTGEPPLVGNRCFWRSDFMTHHRPGWYASVRMFSNRLFSTDRPHNDEGLKSHHLADGCTYIMRTGMEYHDIFPVWDWWKIPGTTVELTPELEGDICRKGTTSFAGGVSDGMYGVAAFDFERDGLTARKAWFFFDEGFVCLGAGIGCRSGNRVVTTLNQCFLEDGVTVSYGGKAETVERGDHTLSGVEWVHHDGIAYVFPEPSDVRMRNDVRKGSWWSINHQYSKDEIARDVFTLWLDHGKNPADARYTYVVLPGVTLSETASYHARPPVEILSNEPDIQAVRNEAAGVTGAAFYAPGALVVPGETTVETDAPCLLLLRREREGRYSVSVSDPGRANDTIRIRMTPAGASRTAEPMTVRFELPGGMYAGRSVTKTVDVSGRR